MSKVGWTEILISLVFTVTLIHPSEQNGRKSLDSIPHLNCSPPKNSSEACKHLAAKRLLLKRSPQQDYGAHFSVENYSPPQLQQLMREQQTQNNSPAPSPFSHLADLLASEESVQNPVFTPTAQTQFQKAVSPIVPKPIPDWPPQPTTPSKTQTFQFDLNLNEIKPQNRDFVQTQQKFPSYQRQQQPQQFFQQHEQMPHPQDSLNRNNDEHVQQQQWNQNEENPAPQFHNDQIPFQSEIDQNRHQYQNPQPLEPHPHYQHSNRFPLVENLEPETQQMLQISQIQNADFSNHDPNFQNQFPAQTQIVQNQDPSYLLSDPNPAPNPTPQSRADHFGSYYDEGPYPSEVSISPWLPGPPPSHGHGHSHVHDHVDVHTHSHGHEHHTHELVPPHKEELVASLVAEVVWKIISSYIFVFIANACISLLLKYLGLADSSLETKISIGPEGSHPFAHYSDKDKGKKVQKPKGWGWDAKKETYYPTNPYYHPSSALYNHPTYQYYPKGKEYTMLGYDQYHATKFYKKYAKKYAKKAGKYGLKPKPLLPYIPVQNYGNDMISGWGRDDKNVTNGTKNETVTKTKSDRIGTTEASSEEKRSKGDSGESFEEEVTLIPEEGNTESPPRENLNGTTQVKSAYAGISNLNLNRTEEIKANNSTS